MVEECIKCTCLNKCSSRRRDVNLRNNSVPKKLLVALSVVVIVAMCLRPVEAAPEHRRHRPHRHNNMAKPIKDTEASRIEAHTHEVEKTTKEQRLTRLLPNDQYGRELQKVKHKMANTKDNFDEQRRKLTEPRGYGSGMPEWLPKTNFVAIHNKSNNIASMKNVSRSKRFFYHNIRQLYKSLAVYHELFKIFVNVKVELPDTQIASYDVKRQDFFTRTINDLYSTIEDIKDAMINVKMPIPKGGSLKRLKLNKIELKVNAAKYLKNDEILFRGYGNLLENWNLELNCSKVTKSVKKGMFEKCEQYRKNLKGKRIKRRRNKHKKL